MTYSIASGTIRVPFTPLPLESNQGKLDFFAWKLRWRQGHLRVSAFQSPQISHRAINSKKQALVSCLKFSSVTRVRVDPYLSESDLKLWADHCAAVGKPLSLSLPTHSDLPEKRHPIQWQIKRLCDRLAASLILLILSPMLLGLTLLIKLQSPGPVFFRQWRVGHRGRLFRVLKFRTMIPDAEKLHHQVMGNQTGLHKCQQDPRVTPLGRVMRKFSLDEFPQLINVLRGEMSLVGPRPWALYDAVRIPPSGQHRLHALPGITGQWQVSARSKLLDLEAVNQTDLSYLSQWSLWTDLKILLMTIPKVISGFGAY